MAERHNIGPHHLLIRPWLSYLAGTFLGREKAVNCVTLPRNCRFPRFVSAAFFHLRRRKARGGGRGRDESTNGRLYRHGTILRSIRGRTGGMNVKYSNFNSSSSISSPFFFFWKTSILDLEQWFLSAFYRSWYVRSYSWPKPFELFLDRCERERSTNNGNDWNNNRRWRCEEV